MNSPRGDSRGRRGQLSDRLAYQIAYCSIAYCTVLAGTTYAQIAYKTMASLSWRNWTTIWTDLVVLSCIESPYPSHTRGFIVISQVFVAKSVAFIRSYAASLMNVCGPPSSRDTHVYDILVEGPVVKRISVARESGSIDHISH